MKSDSVQDVVVADIAAKKRNALVGGPFGSNLVSRDYVESGIPVIRGQNMGGGRWVNGDFVYVTEDKANSLSANLAQAGDVVFTQRGTLGQVAIIPNNGLHEKYVISQSQMKLSPDLEKVDPLYLYYEFTSPQQLAYIANNAIQTGVPHTNLTTLRNTPLTLPPLPEQKAIAHILGSLDDKIEVNRRMNETLEAMAQALFKSWFVDFDPVIDNALASNQPIPEELAHRAEIRKQVLADPTAPKSPHNDLFPAAFQLTEEMGWIPEGWEVACLQDFGKVVTGKTPPKSVSNAYGNGAMFLTPTDYLGSLVTINTIRRVTEAGAESIRNSMLEKGAVCVTCIGSQMGKSTLVNEQVFTNQQINSVIPSCNSHRAFLLFNLHSQRAKLHSLGSSGSTMPILNKNTFSSFPILSPVSKILDCFQSSAEINLSKIEFNLRQIESLTKLRDTLLPKLISGELRSPAAENLPSN